MEGDGIISTTSTQNLRDAIRGRFSTKDRTTDFNTKNTRLKTPYHEAQKPV